MNSIVGERLKEFRLKKGFTQEVMADLLCLSQSAYARMESGQTNSWTNHLPKICEVLEIDPNELLTAQSLIINQDQKGTTSNSTFIIKQLYEKLIEQFEKRIQEKDIKIQELRNKLNRN